MPRRRHSCRGHLTRTEGRDGAAATGEGRSVRGAIEKKMGTNATFKPRRRRDVSSGNAARQMSRVSWSRVSANRGTRPTLMPESSSPREFAGQSTAPRHGDSRLRLVATMNGTRISCRKRAGRAESSDAPLVFRSCLLAIITSPTNVLRQLQNLVGRRVLTPPRRAGDSPPVFARFCSCLVLFTRIFQQVYLLLRNRRLFTTAAL